MSLASTSIRRDASSLASGMLTCRLCGVGCRGQAGACRTPCQTGMTTIPMPLWRMGPCVKSVASSSGPQPSLHNTSAVLEFVLMHTGAQIWLRKSLNALHIPTCRLCVPTGRNHGGQPYALNTTCQIWKLPAPQIRFWHYPLWILWPSCLLFLTSGCDRLRFHGSAVCNDPRVQEKPSCAKLAVRIASLLESSVQDETIQEGDFCCSCAERRCNFRP